MEMARPEAGRVASDPFARRFVNPLSVHFMRLVSALGITRLIGIEGLLNFAVAREKHIENAMRHELSDGIEQVVILGAGFDTRAYRIPEASGVPIFEVDHPVTQSAKREALHNVIDPLPENVCFVGVDFDHDDLGERLRANGYSPSLRTLFVWQGVIVYLTREGANRTLEFIAHNSGSGSLVVFDSIDSKALAGAGALGLRFFTGAMGENITFGIGLDDIVPYLEARGFADVEIFGHEQMQSTYLGSRPIAPGVYIASARVPLR